MIRAAALALVIVIGGTRLPAADPSERNRRERVYHVLPIVGGGAVYALSELVLEELITPQICRWCEPNALDTA